jgi:thioredoxin 1
MIAFQIVIKEMCRNKLSGFIKNSWGGRRQMRIGQIKGRLLLFTLLMTLFLSVQANAAPVDGRLAKAVSEGKIVMLEIGSVGCIPCDKMRPVMARLSSDYSGKLEVIFVDVKKDQKSARKFGVHAIPTQVFLDKNGKEFHRHIGYYEYDKIAVVLKKAGI